MKKTRESGLSRNSRVAQNFVKLAALMAAIVLTGCATHRYQGASENPEGYNPETGYPLVGSTSIPRL